MTHAIIPVATPTYLDALREMGTESLRAELAQSLRVTAEHLLRLAWIVRVLEERGEDLSELRLSLLPYLRQIAYGQVLPEVVVRYAPYPGLLSRLTSLPEPDQRAIAEGEGTLVVVPDPDGGWTHRRMDPVRMTAKQVAQVFARGHIRSEAEQIALLESRPGEKKRKPAGVGRIRVDHARGGLTLGRAFYPLADVVQALGDLRGQDDIADEGERSPLMIQLGTEEHRRLKVRAAQGDTTMADLARNALRAAGLI